MSTTVKVESSDASVRVQRETVAQRVLTQFGDRLPDLRLLCFLDTEDWQPFRDYAGEANRGFYTPLKRDTFTWPPWPDYVMAHIFVNDPASISVGRAFDHVIYLHGSSCEDQVGLTMTLAHELQHFVQYGSARKVWAENSLIPMLSRDVIAASGLQWSDIPIEREARTVSKRIAEKLFDADRVARYIDTRITGALNAADRADWKFVRELSTSVPYDLESATRLIYKRLYSFRGEIKGLLEGLKDDPDFAPVDLNELCEGYGSS
jgi:hypothetical protein